MTKKLFALLLAVVMVLGLFAGCGSNTASTAESAPAAESAAVSEAAPAEEAPAEEPAQEEAPAEEASAAEEVVEEPAYEKKYNFPGSDTARLSYINEYTLPISEEGNHHLDAQCSEPYGSPG